MTIKLNKHDKINENHDKKLKITLISWLENTKKLRRKNPLLIDQEI